jgi:hypothetical protein
MYYSGAFVQELRKTGKNVVQDGMCSYRGSNKKSAAYRPEIMLYGTRIYARETKLTPWSRVLPEKLTCPQLLKKFPAFCGSNEFITAFKTACHLSLS